MAKVVYGKKGEDCDYNAWKTYIDDNRSFNKQLLHDRLIGVIDNDDTLELKFQERNDLRMMLSFISLLSNGKKFGVKIDIFDENKSLSNSVVYGKVSLVGVTMNFNENRNANDATGVLGEMIIKVKK